MHGQKCLTVSLIGAEISAAFMSLAVVGRPVHVFSWGRSFVGESIVFYRLSVPPATLHRRRNNRSLLLCDLQPLLNSYSGVYLSIGYHISAKIERGLMRNDLSKKLEFMGKRDESMDGPRASEAKASQTDVVIRNVSSNTGSDDVTPSANAVQWLVGLLAPAHVHCRPPSPQRQLLSFDGPLGSWILRRSTSPTLLACGPSRCCLSSAVEVPGEIPASSASAEVPFEITPETLEFAPKRYGGGRQRRLRPFRVTGRLHGATISTTRPLTGEVVVEESERPIKVSRTAPDLPRCRHRRARARVCTRFWDGYFRPSGGVAREGLEGYEVEGGYVRTGTEKFGGLFFLAHLTMPLFLLCACFVPRLAVFPCTPRIGRCCC